MNIQEIIERCADIMQKYPELFPIVNTIRQKPEKNNIKEIIETQIGISFIINNVANSCQLVWFYVDKNTIEKAVVTNTLIHYINRNPNVEETKLWALMLEQENLANKRQ